MGKVDLALMNVYYISAHATLGFELTSFRILYDSSCPSFRFSHSFFAMFSIFSNWFEQMDKSSIDLERNKSFSVPEIIPKLESTIQRAIQRKHF